MAFRYSCGHAEKEAEVSSVCEKIQDAGILQLAPRRELVVPCGPCFRGTTEEARASWLATLGARLPDGFLDFFWLLVLIEEQLARESGPSPAVRLLDTWTKHVRHRLTYKAGPIVAIDRYVRRHHGPAVYLDVHATLNAQSVSHRSMDVARFDELHRTVLQAAAGADAMVERAGRGRPPRTANVPLRDATRKVFKAAALYASALTGPPRESQVHAEQLRSVVHWEQAPMYEWLMDTVVELCRNTEAAGLLVKAEMHNLGRLTAAGSHEKGAALVRPWKETLEALKTAANNAVPWYTEKAKKWKTWRAYAQKWDERIEDPMRFDIGRTKSLYDRAMEAGEDARTRRRDRGAEKGT